jgi:hypothetical protein
MELTELKQLLGIAESDTSQDAILSLYLEAAIEAAKGYADKADFSKVLPGPIKLGILRYVELSQLRKATAGIQSESMSGMSQTFRDGNTDSNYYAEAYDFWKPYHTNDNRLVFRTSKRRNLRSDPVPGITGHCIRKLD